MIFPIYKIEARAGTCGECASCIRIDAPEYAESCWDWDSWQVIGALEALPFDDRDIIAALVERDMIRPAALKACDVEDDGHNLVVVDKRSREPFFAVAYSEIMNQEVEHEVERMLRTHA